jgi:hypothetical protein
MIDPELNELYNTNDPEQQAEPECNLIMKKCCNEMIAILLYFFAIIGLIVGLIHNISVGKILTCLIEFGIALLID